MAEYNVQTIRDERDAFVLPAVHMAPILSLEIDRDHGFTGWVHQSTLCLWSS